MDIGIKMTNEEIKTTLERFLKNCTVTVEDEFVRVRSNFTGETITTRGIVAVFENDLKREAHFIARDLGGLTYINFSAY